MENMWVKIMNSNNVEKNMNCEKIKLGPPSD